MQRRMLQQAGWVGRPIYFACSTFAFTLERGKGRLKKSARPSKGCGFRYQAFRRSLPGIKCKLLHRLQHNHFCAGNGLDIPLGGMADKRRFSRHGHHVEHGLCGFNHGFDLRWFNARQQRAERVELVIS